MSRAWIGLLAASFALVGVAAWREHTDAARFAADRGAA